MITASRLLLTTSAVAASLAFAGAAAADGDHPAPVVKANAPIGTGLNAGGPGATWKLLTTFPTGNPHTDLDFFTRGGETYASVGTLGIGPNAGGQTIVQLTQRGQIEPRIVASHPSGACLSNPSAALSLQHDVEATPKTDSQLLLDATDANGRCHDQGTAGLSGAPRGGLELIDITNVVDPVEIGLTSHVGEAHTVNVDPKRPHIAYSVTSDAVGVSGGKRQNEVPGSGDRNDLDGFEVVDLSSCMNFPLGTSVDLKRMLCKPQVYRYRFPTLEMSLGHTVKSSIYGCHELEVYADDRLTCGSRRSAARLRPDGRVRRPRHAERLHRRQTAWDGARLLIAAEQLGRPIRDGRTGHRLHEESGRFQPRRPDLARRRAHPRSRVCSTSAASITRAAAGRSRRRRTTTSTTRPSSRRRGRLLLATDERGGGVTPPGATCSPVTDIENGNGGLHAYSIDKLTTAGPTTPAAAWEAYASTPAGGKAIFRVPIRTQPQASLCTAHVFQQIPGQNRIFMGWYTQGTQVVDFVENADGTVEFTNAGWFIPEHANTWTSAVFKTRENADGTFTYWGATGDFALGISGRSAIDVYEVTLPAPPAPRAG